MRVQTTSVISDIVLASDILHLNFFYSYFLNIYLNNFKYLCKNIPTFWFGFIYRAFCFICVFFKIIKNLLHKLACMVLAIVGKIFWYFTFFAKMQSFFSLFAEFSKPSATPRSKFLNIHQRHTYLTATDNSWVIPLDYLQSRKSTYG